MYKTRYPIKEENYFRYIEEGNGEDTLVLLHGLFMSWSNFDAVIDSFKKTHKVLVPILPLYSSELSNCNLDALNDYLEAFIEQKNVQQPILIGNSLGGHLALLYTLRHKQKVKGLVLASSSGMFDKPLGFEFPKRDYETMYGKLESSFYHADLYAEEKVHEMLELVTNREKIARLLSFSKSAIRNNLKEHVPEIKIPVLLIWGKKDSITPKEFGEAFLEHLPDATLHISETSGHAPMMESPEEFNTLVLRYLNKLNSVPYASQGNNR